MSVGSYCHCVIFLFSLLLLLFQYLNFLLPSSTYRHVLGAPLNTPISVYHIDCKDAISEYYMYYYHRLNLMDTFLHFSPMMYIIGRF